MSWPGPAHVVPAWHAADVAAADAARIAQGADLMAVAAAGLATTCASRLRVVRGRVSGARVVLLVGPGNNGGDALLAGALLRRRGVGVDALLTADRHHEPGARALLRAGGRVLAAGDGTSGTWSPGAAAQLLRRADLVVDGVLGIGARGAVRGRGAALLAALVEGPRPAVVVACDLPSGLDPDSGAPSGQVLAADVTVAFGVAKPGLLLPDAQPFVGDLVVVPLGLEPHLPALPALRRLRATGSPDPLVAGWPWPWRSSDKYARGVLGLAAGEAAYPGAAVLVARAAAGAGVGMVRVVPPGRTAADGPSVAEHVLRDVPEVVVQPLDEVGRVQAWVTGPGTGGGAAGPGGRGADDRAVHVLTVADEPAVVDAGALTVLAHVLSTGALRRPERLLLTPHAGELDRLLDALGEPPAATVGGWSAARLVAARTGATVLLKGPDTLVVAPDGRTVVVPGGPPSLATAGAGDVLAGLAGALLAAGLEPAQAGAMAAHVHARAAWRASGGGGPLRAGAVADALAGVVASARAGSWDDV